MWHALNVCSMHGSYVAWYAAGIVCYVWCGMHYMYICGPRRRIQFNLQQILSHCGADLNSIKNLIATYCRGTNTHRSPTRARNEVQRIQLTNCVHFSWKSTPPPTYLPPPLSFFSCLPVVMTKTLCAQFFNFSAQVAAPPRPMSATFWRLIGSAWLTRPDRRALPPAVTRFPLSPLSPCSLSLSVSTKVLLMACFY